MKRLIPEIQPSSQFKGIVYLSGVSTSKNRMHNDLTYDVLSDFFFKTTILSTSEENLPWKRQ